MLSNILRNGKRFSCWYHRGAHLQGVGFVSLCDNGKVYLCLDHVGSIELTGRQAAIVRGILALS